MALGLGDVIDGMKDIAGDAIRNTTKESVMSFAKEAGVNAVKGAAAGGAAGGLGNAIRGKDFWEGAGSGAKVGAVAGIGATAYKRAGGEELFWGRDSRDNKFDAPSSNPKLIKKSDFESSGDIDYSIDFPIGGMPSGPASSDFVTPLRSFKDAAPAYSSFSLEDRGSADASSYSPRGENSQQFSGLMGVPEMSAVNMADYAIKPKKNSPAKSAVSNSNAASYSKQGNSLPVNAMKSLAGNLKNSFVKA